MTKSDVQSLCDECDAKLQHLQNEHAVRLWKRVTQQGSTRAMRRFGEHHSLTPSDEMAVDWFQRGIAQGDDLAAYWRESPP